MKKKHLADRIAAEVDQSDGQFEFFKNMPDEIILMIGKCLEPKSVKALRQVSVRFRTFAFLLINKLDHKFVQDEPSLYNDDQIFQFILKCSNLRHLSLIVHEERTVTRSQSRRQSDPLLGSIITDANSAKTVGITLARHCPNIRCIEVSGLGAIRMVREYSRALSSRSCCNLEEIRTYTIQDYNTLYTIMRVVNQFCPTLNTFKLLQREKSTSRERRIKVPFENLWTEMSHKLTKFSTNISNEEIIRSSISTLYNLERIVVWGLNSEAMDILSRNLVNLQILILMSADLTGIHFISRLKNLTELHVKVQPGFRSPNGFEQMILEQKFNDLFSKIGSKLRKLSFNFRGCSTSNLLDSIPQHCTSLIELRFSECTDCDHLFGLALKVQKLECFAWNGEQKVSSISHLVQKQCNNLIRKRSSLKRVVAYNFIYMPVSSVNQI